MGFFLRLYGERFIKLNLSLIKKEFFSGKEILFYLSGICKMFSRLFVADDASPGCDRTDCILLLILYQRRKIFLKFGKFSFS